jgi:hypothetical protein
VPEALFLVKGSTRQISQDVGFPMGEKTTNVEVLVLARTEGPEGEYRRVGAGRLRSWDAAVESLDSGVASPHDRCSTSRFPSLVRN